MSAAGSSSTASGGAGTVLPPDSPDESSPSPHAATASAAPTAMAARRDRFVRAGRMFASLAETDRRRRTVHRTFRSVIRTHDTTKNGYEVAGLRSWRRRARSLGDGSPSDQA